MSLPRDAAGWIGGQIGDFLASRWGPQVRAAFDGGTVISAPLGRALIDAFIVDRIGGLVWPSFAVLGIMLSIEFVSRSSLGRPEFVRIGAGSIVLFMLVWSSFGIIKGATMAWPHIRFWYVVRLSPIRHVRLILFNEIRERHRELEAGLRNGGLGGEAVAAALDGFQRRLKFTPDQFCFELANQLAPILVRHLIGRLILVMTPVAVAVIYYRFVVYPQFIRHISNGLGPWRLALYPLAAFSDIALGTHLRAMLSSSG